MVTLSNVETAAAAPAGARAFGLPCITARALGRFRALLGAGLFLIVVTHPIGAVPLEAQRAYSPLAAVPWVRALAASDPGTFAVHVAACAAAAAFAFGFAARASYAVLVGALFVRTLLILLQAGAHDWGTPLLTLAGLMAVPWSASARRPYSPDARSEYGFAVWLPGLTIGLAFLAASIEKLRRSGLDWITTGAVRYHFVEDAPNAPFELGMWVATQPRLAVALSLAGILVEAAFIAIVLFRGWRARALFGAAGAGLLLGFYVFQGIHWWPWLLLFAAFLPWAAGHAAASAGGSRLTAVQWSVVVLLVAGQTYASVRRMEIEPILSHYPMYSSTYDSPEYYERQHTRLRFFAGDADVTDRVEAAGGADTLRRALDDPAAVTPGSELAQALAAFRERYRRLYGGEPIAIEGFQVSRPFDWDIGRFKPEVREPAGSVPLVP